MIRPPALAERLLARVLGPGPWTESILGDLHEEHAAIARRHPRGAALWYLGQAGRLMLRSTIRLTRREPRARHPSPHTGDSVMRTLLLDARYSLRSMVKRPTTTAIVIVTLALALGANAAIFAIVDALVLRPFHFPDSDRIALLAETSPEGENFRQESTSPANFLDWRRQVDTIEHLSALRWWDVNLVGTDEPEAVQGFEVSPGFFEALGTQPLLGRGFIKDDETIGRHRVAVLGHGLWRRRFAGDSAIVGRTIDLDGHPYEVVGIAPEAFEFPNGTEVWAPLALDAETAARRRSRYLTVIGRLAPGRSLEDAQAQMAVVAERLEAAYPEDNRGRAIRVYTLAQGMLDEGLAPILSMWQASALFVLLIACANVANLLLARGAERQRELAVRLAIGASRARIVRQLIIESVFVGLAAVPAALLAAHVGLRVLVSYMPAKIARFVPGWHDINVDGRLMAFTVLLALGTAVVFGLLPALHASRPRLAEALKDGGRTSTVGRHRLRRGLVVAEIALALPLLVATGLSAIGINRFLNGDQGYNPDNVLTMKVSLSEGRHPDEHAWRRFTSSAVERLRAVPGVEAAAAVNIMPAFGGNSSRGIEIDGRPNPADAEPPLVDYRTTTPALFDVLQVPIVQGRGFSDADREGAQLTAIISESLARRFWPGADPIGRRIRIVQGEWRTVVGVCGDVIHNWFHRRNYPTLYVPAAQAPANFLALLVRTSGDPAHMTAGTRAAVHAIDPTQPVFDLLTMREALKERTLGLQYVAAIMGVFGGFALVLAVVGVYSVMAYLVTQRTHEIGVRVALGATPADVLRLTIGQAGRLTLLGVAAGALLATALGRTIEAGLLGTASGDARLVAGFGAVLVLAAIAAGYFPARRAAHVDPLVALRAE